MIGRFARGALRSNPIQRLVQPRVVDGFEQIVDGARRERIERVLIVGGDEYRQRHHRCGHRAQQSETIDTGHLHVEEHQVRPQRGNGTERFAAVTGGADDFHVVMPRQTQFEPTLRERFVVDDERADFHGNTCAVSVAGARSNGNLTCTSKPLGMRLAVRNS